MSDVVYLGDDKPVRFTVPTDLAIELAGATLYCDVKVRGGEPIPASQTSVDVASGVAWAWFLSALTASLAPRATYSGDGVLLLADGHRHTIGTFSFDTRERVTPTP